MSRYLKKMHHRFGFLVSGLLMSCSVHAGIPVWTYSPPNPTSVAIINGGTATVVYTVTNQSYKAKNLKLQATPGLSASACYLAHKGSTCNITLTINSNEIPKDGIHTGPMFCEQGNLNQCYQPEAANQLNIKIIQFTPGHLVLSQFGSPVSTLALSPGDNGALLLSNTGPGNASSLNIQLPFGWQSYFTNNCPALLAPQQSCSLFYAIPTPSAVGILNPLTIQATGVDNSIAVPVSIQTLGEVNCWGANFNGQLGNGTSGNGANSSTPIPVNSISNVVSITGGKAHSCALLNTGAASCWGDNSSGQLGNGTNNDSSIPTPVSIISNALAITAGGDHTCALLNSNTVNCWGANGSGQLGNGTNTNSNTPVPVSNISNAVAITGGNMHTCVLLDTGTVRCWGDNSSGQLGNGTNTSSNSPVPVSNINNAVAITGGGAHTCALLNTGAINCWGYNFNGQLGNGGNTDSNTPVSVNNISNAVAITAGGLHTCSLLDTNTIYCWGSNTFGELGNGTSGSSSSTPLLVSNISNGVAVTGGQIHTCALLDTGAVNCWGYNLYGELGNNTITNSNIPVTTCSGPGCPSSLIGLGLFNHDLGNHSCAITP